MQLKIDAIVFMNGYVVIELEPGTPEFWIELGPDVGWGRFVPNESRPIKSDKIPIIPPTTHKPRVPYVLREVRPAHEPRPSPIVSSLGVLWRRQAAIEAHQRIVAYQLGQDPIPRSSARSRL